MPPAVGSIFDGSCVLLLGAPLLPLLPLPPFFLAAFFFRSSASFSSITFAATSSSGMILLYFLFWATLSGVSPWSFSAPGSAPYSIKTLIAAMLAADCVRQAQWSGLLPFWPTVCTGTPASSSFRSCALSPLVAAMMMGGARHHNSSVVKLNALGRSDLPSFVLKFGSLTAVT